MQLLVAAYPLLAEADMTMIQSYRKQHDPLCDVIAPHFTFVFPEAGIAEEAFVREIRSRAEWGRRLNFVLRCATVSKDSFSNDYHVFLVPDEGYSYMVKLHDQLYDGTLLPFRRFDIHYIPHISIARSNDMMKMKELADEWNNKNISIHGQITTLDVLCYDEGVVRTVCKIDLR